MADAVTYLERHELIAIQRVILRRFSEFCDSRGLTYYLHGGSLLGAVLFGDYIPWDDDIDVTMPRADYERFLELRGEEGLAGLLFLEPRLEPSYPYAYTKLGAAGTRLIDYSAGGREWPVNIDVFPLDDSAKPGWRRRLQRGVRWVPHTTLVLAIDTKARGWRRAVTTVVRRGAHVIGLNRLARCLNWWVARPRSGTHDLALLAWGPAPPIAKNNWADRVELDFGPDRFWAPQGYESVLAGSFGPDYRKPYPAELRVNPHHFQAFREGADDWLRIADEGDAAPGRAS